MSYQDAIDALSRMTPELFVRQGQPRRKFSLDEMRTLLAALGDPQKKFPALLIAGTNGKGSTAATLAAILQASGLKAGLYISPHLERVNERIRLNGKEIEDGDFARFFFLIEQTAHQLVESGKLPQPPSFFEVLTAIAFCAFAEAGIELAVLEVGMGGRLDATNVVEPLLSIITDISLDHTEWLGPDIASITREKAGILRPHGILVTLPQTKETNQVLGEIATELDARGSSATPYMPPMGADPESYTLEILGEAVEVKPRLKGAHQQRNLALAITAAVELAAMHFPITAKSIESGICATSWPARLEEVEGRGRKWILDVAHNPAGAWALRGGLKSLKSESKVLVFSCLRDKPLEEMAQILFPLFDEIVFAPIHSARATAVEEFGRIAAKLQVKARLAGSIGEALEIAAQLAGTDPVIVSGSVYLVGEVRSILLHQGS